MVSVLHIVSILLIVLTPLSYWPQYRKLLSVQAADGISGTATLLLALCAQSQMVTMYYLFACPSYKRDGVFVLDPPRFMDWLNLTQLLMQWLCSLVMLGLVLYATGSAYGNTGSETAPAEATTEQAIEQTTGHTADPVADPKTSDMAYPSATTPILLLGLHALLSVFWAALAGRPTRDWLDLPFVVIMSFNYIYINPFITVATGVALGLQGNCATNAPHNRTALSRMTLVLQIVIFSALAVLWPVRFPLPPPERYRYSDPWLVVDWYPLVGWACLNNALIAMGQCFVLYYAVRRTAPGGAHATSRETQPLLAT